MRSIQAEATRIRSWDGKREIQVSGMQEMRWLVRSLKSHCLIIDPKSVLLVGELEAVE